MHKEYAGLRQAESEVEAESASDSPLETEFIVTQGQGDFLAPSARGQTELTVSDEEISTMWKK